MFLGSWDNNNNKNVRRVKIEMQVIEDGKKKTRGGWKHTTHSVSRHEQEVDFMVRGNLDGLK